MKPVIGIVCRALEEESRLWMPSAQGVLSPYINAVQKAGGVPLIMPLINDSRDLSQLYGMVDGVLLAGGGDIHPTFYRQRPRVKLDRVDITRDKIELTLASWAVLDKKPILGICRGLQIVNVSLGGSLHQDLHQEYQTSIDHDGSFNNQDFTYLVHHLLLKENSRLANILKSVKTPINSLHRQSVKELAPTLAATGWADDGVIEAVESNTDHYIVGIQSHPEIMVTKKANWQNLFDDFVHASLKQIPV